MCLLNELSGYDPEDMLLRFLMGLLSNVKGPILTVRVKPTTLEEMITQAEEVESGL